MKKGLIGPFQLSVLNGAAEALKIAETVTHQPSADLEGIFYATAFQAGVDEFIVPEFKDKPIATSDFLANRTKYLSSERSKKHSNLVRAAFSAYLPDAWARNDEYSPIWSLSAFVVEILDAMSEGASVLSPWGIPDMAEAEALLPSELAIPLSNLLSSVSNLQAPSPIQQKALPTEDVRRFNEIISSDLFLKYVSAQSALDDSERPLEKALSVVVSTSRQVFSHNKQLLALRRTGIGVLQVTPKIVDAAFGKLPGALDEVAAKLGFNLMESRRRLVIYDFRYSVQNVLFSNLVRMIRAAEKKE
jgi:hypothetical protein